MGFLDNIKKKTEGITSQIGDISSKAMSSFKGSNILSSEMEQLLNSAIINGQISDTARATLHRRAMKEGIDPDELDLIINARLAKATPQAAPPPPMQQQQLAAPPAMPQMPSNKHGSIKKCPNCGAPVSTFTTNCEVCGFEYSNVEASSNITTLFNKLQELDDELNQKLIQRGVVGRVLGSITESLTSIDVDSSIKNVYAKRKINIIKTFPIGNSKSEILEFLTLAAPLGAKRSIFSGEDDNQREIRKAWREKCAQVIIKARMLLNNDQAAMCQIEKYAKEFKVK